MASHMHLHIMKDLTDEDLSYFKRLNDDSGKHDIAYQKVENTPNIEIVEISSSYCSCSYTWASEIQDVIGDCAQRLQETNHPIINDDMINKVICILLKYKLAELELVEFLEQNRGEIPFIVVW